MTSFSCTFLSNLSASLPFKIILLISTLNLLQIQPYISLYISSINSWIMFLRCWILAHQLSWLSKDCLMLCKLGDLLKAPQLPTPNWLFDCVLGPSSQLEISLNTCKISPNMPFYLVADSKSLGSITSPPKISHISTVKGSMIWLMLHFSQSGQYSFKRRSMNWPMGIGESKSKYFLRNMRVSSCPLRLCSPSSSSNRPLLTTDSSRLDVDLLRTRLREWRSVDLSLPSLLMAFSRGRRSGEVVTRSSMREGVRLLRLGRGMLGLCFCLGVNCCCCCRFILVEVYCQLFCSLAFFSAHMAVNNNILFPPRDI